MEQARDNWHLNDSEIAAQVSAFTNGYINSDLKRRGLFSIEKIIESKDDLERAKILKYSDKMGLALDRENRLYDLAVCFQRRILHNPYIKIKNSKYVKLSNCIIYGDLFISGGDDGVVKVSLDTCVVLGALRISLLEGASEIDLQSCNINLLDINRCSTESIFIYQCRILSLKILEVKSLKFLIDASRLRYASIVDPLLKEVQFDCRQFESHFYNERFAEFKLSDIGILEKEFKIFEYWQVDPKLFTDDRIEDTRVKTLNFIQRYGNIKADREVYSKISSELTLLYQSSNISKLIMKLLGGFVSWQRLFLLFLIDLLIFSAIYSTPYFEFTFNSETLRGLDFLDAVYFSGTTILTIGYGDIVPLGSTRYFALAEGITGILLTSSILVAFVRKYADN